MISWEWGDGGTNPKGRVHQFIIWKIFVENTPFFIFIPFSAKILPNRSINIFVPNSGVGTRSVWIPPLQKSVKFVFKHIKDILNCLIEQFYLKVFDLVKKKQYIINLCNFFHFIGGINFCVRKLSFSETVEWQNPRSLSNGRILTHPL